MNILGDRIKKEREKLGLTREDLAKKIGVSYSAIAMYEQGNREPNKELTLKMCKIFDCSMDYLMGITNVKNFKNIVSDTLSDLGIEITHYIPEFANVRNFNLSENEMNFLLNELFILLKSNNSSNIDAGIVSRLKKSNIDYSNIKYALFIIEGTARNLKENEEAFNTIQSKLKKYFSNFNEKQYYMCPVYGQISARQPNWAEENIEGRIPINTNLMNIVNPEDHFFLRVNR